MKNEKINSDHFRNSEAAETPEEQLVQALTLWMDKSRDRTEQISQENHHFLRGSMQKLETQQLQNQHLLKEMQKVMGRLYTNHQLLENTKIS